MIYEYCCKKCDNKFDVIKSVAYIDNIESCPLCKSSCDPECRVITGGSGFYGADDWDKPVYQPAFGKVMRNRAEVKREAKRRGMEEIGTEPVEKVHKHFEQQNQDIRDKNWDSV